MNVNSLTPAHDRVRMRVCVASLIPNPHFSELWCYTIPWAAPTTEEAPLSECGLEKYDRELEAGLRDLIMDG